MALIKKRVPKDGCEDIYNMAVKKLETIDEETRVRIEMETADKKAVYNNIIAETSVEIEEEVPDEETATAETEEPATENLSE